MTMALAVVEAANRILTELTEAAAATPRRATSRKRLSVPPLSTASLGLPVGAVVEAEKFRRTFLMTTDAPPHLHPVVRLRNDRHEAFAHHVAQGLSGSQAYALAYGRACSPGTRVSAHRLLMKANVRRRIAELLREILSQCLAAHGVIVGELEATARAQIRAGHLRSACRTAAQIVNLARQIASELVVK